MADRKLSQSQILQDLKIPRSEWKYIEGNGKGQQAINQAAAKAGLPQPFNPSFASALIQDLLPIGGIVASAGVAAAAGAASAGAGADAAAGDAGAGTTTAAAGGGGAAGYASKTLSDLSSLAKAGGLAALLVDPSFTWRMVKIIGGAILIFLGLRQLAAAGGANVGSRMVAR